MKIGVIGSGVVGETLANGFLKHGHDVVRGSREPKKLESWRMAAGKRASTATFADAARAGEVVVLAVKGTAAEEALRLCEAGNLAGKVVIDATNPIADAPPDDGVLRFFTGPNDSLMERLQPLAPGALFVKAFSSVGNVHMVNPDFGGRRPTMFVCGDDPVAKETVRKLLDQLGWDMADMGGVKSARAIEPLCQLWCLPGLLRDEWGHAFALLRKDA
jgi:predicted dinucleotide-binding enzyme